jgi:NAD(P)-dependent dehydrogenase (short-subunit alcohol dehydrogenase family)
LDFKAPAELLDFSGKVVLVTGGSVGIGAGIAKRFAAAGADVVVSYRSHADEADAIAHAIRATGRKALTVQADVAVAAEVESLFKTAIDQFSKIDVMINNAGNYPRALILDMTEAQWDEVVDVNLKGTFLCTQAAAQHMVERGDGGAIVNIASIEAVNPAAEHSHYVAAKAGVVMFTQTAALELGQHRIRVNSVSPGLINAPILPQVWPEGLERWLNRAPLGRVGEPEDVADACLFLASDAARWITGTDILVDGGVMTNQIY